MRATRRKIILTLVGLMNGTSLFADTLVMPPPNFAVVQAYAEFTPEQKEWCLATSALLTVANGYSPVDLSEGKVGQVKIDEARKVLRGWKIYKKSDLYSAIRYVQETGHRTQFDYLLRKTRGLTPEATWEMIQQSKSPELLNHRVQVVQKFGETVGGKGIFAFDYARIVSLAKWGYMAEYISEQEAWEVIVPTAIQIQAYVTSWKELAHQYRVGRLFLEPDPTGEMEQKFNHAQDYLFQNPQSPWLRLPWNLSLARKALP